MVTQNLNTVTEEEQINKDDARFKEINTKTEAERTDVEKKELGELKERHGSRAEKRIGQLSGEKKAAQERAERAERLAEERDTKIKELEGKIDIGQPQIPAGDENETIEIDGKKWYSDGALSVQMKAGKISEQAAIDYQTKRNRKETVVEVREEIRKEETTKTINTTREEDAQVVLNQHPEFAVKHQNHNPNDPLYVQWKELIADGYGTNPKGLTKALKKAKQILGIKDTHIDRSSDLGLEDAASPADKGGGKGKEKEIAFTEAEEDSAVNMFTSVNNPATNRLYTRDEAIAKAKAAKKARMK